MDDALLSKSEVAARLHICERSLSTYGSRYPIYKADSAGVYHPEHVRILENVRANILTPEDGYKLWEFKRKTIRRTLMIPLACDAEVSRKHHKGKGSINV